MSKLPIALTPERDIDPAEVSAALKYLRKPTSPIETFYAGVLYEKQRMCKEITKIFDLLDLGD